MTYATRPAIPDDYGYIIATFARDVPRHLRKGSGATNACVGMLRELLGILDVFVAVDTEGALHGWSMFANGTRFYIYRSKHLAGLGLTQLLADAGKVAE